MQNCKKCIVLFLVFSLILLPSATFANAKRGSNITIEKIGGGSVYGELITVRPDSILVLTAEGIEERGETVELSEIRVIRIWKVKSNPVGRIIVSTVSMASIWGLSWYGLASLKGEYPAALPKEDRLKHAKTGAAIGAAVGLLIGIIGASNAKAQLHSYEIEGMNSTQLAKTLRKLRRQARIPKSEL